MAQRLSGRGQEGEISLGGINGTFDEKSDWILIFFSVPKMEELTCVGEVVEKTDANNKCANE
jgi:hypothetical protein